MEITCPQFGLKKTNLSIVCLTSIVNVPPDRLSGWHMDHLENKKFDPCEGQHKKPKIAHEEYAKCVLKCSACHKQGPRASWEQ